MKKSSLCLICIFLGILFSTNAVAQSARVYEKDISLNTYPFSDPNPVPEISRIYPYFHYQGYTNRGHMRDWKMVVLENDYIQVFVCPAVGGKVWGAVEKSTGNEFLYFNHAVKFRNVAMRGPWTSGGLEYNFGDIGHIPTCATPVDYHLKNNPDGSVSCVVGAEDLPSGSRWNIEIVVHPGKAFFETRVSWHNGSDLPGSYYHWMNAAAKTAGDLEFIYPGNKWIGHGGNPGEWPVENGRDLSRYENNNFGSYKSYHVINSYSDFFGGYWHDDEFGFGHLSSYDDKPGKKLWIWGLSPQGMIWEDLLTDSDGQYIEFQAGKLFNQAAASSTFTPFKHREFNPFDADLMDEAWFPLKETGGMVAASKHAVMNLESENGRNRLSLSALQPLDSELKVRSNDRLVLSEKVQLKPLELFEAEFYCNSNFRVELGDHLLRYSSNPEDFLAERPLKPNPEFDYTTAYGLYIKALELEKQRRYREAEKLYQESLQQEPAYSPALNRMALSWLRKGDAEKALEYLRRSMAVDTYDDEANYLFGLANRDLGRANEAKSGFSIAAASVRYRSAAYTQLAAIFLRENDLPKAEKYGRKALAFNAYNYHAYEILAVTARKQGDRTEAVKIQCRLGELDAVNPFYRFEDYLLEPSGEKLAEINSSITNELPHETYLSLARRYLELGCDEAALEVLGQAPQTPIVLLWRAGLDSNNRPALLRRASEASPELVFPFRMKTAELLEKLLSENDNWKFHYYLGLIYWNLGLEEKTKELFNLCGDRPDYAPFYLAKAKLFADDETQFEDCLKKARALDPDDWRAALAQVRFNLSRRKAEEARATSKAFLETHPENSEMGMSYARSLIQLEQFPAAVSFLETFNVLPYEGATIGRLIYHEACIRAALVSLASGKYDEALKYGKKARLWPKNLGVGEPYDPDTRLDDFTIAVAEQGKNNKPGAAAAFSSVSEYANPPGREENSKLILQLMALREEGKTGKADQLLDSFLKKHPGNKHLQWVKEKFRNSGRAQEIELEILGAPGEIQPYDEVFVDREFRLVVEFLKLAG